MTNRHEVYSDFDADHRARRTDYLDGTFTQSAYGCCGLTVFTNREGTVTTYGYDPLKRLTTTTANGTTTSNALDAAGRVLATVRYGSDDSAITLSSVYLR